MIYSEIYQEGWEAYINLVAVSENPYEDTSCISKKKQIKSKRQCWFDGWYDARRIMKHGLNEGEECPKFAQNYVS